MKLYALSVRPALWSITEFAFALTLAISTMVLAPAAIILVLLAQPLVNTTIASLVIQLPIECPIQSAALVLASLAMLTPTVPSALRSVATEWPELTLVTMETLSQAMGVQVPARSKRISLARKT